MNRDGVEGDSIWREWVNKEVALSAPTTPRPPARSPFGALMTGTRHVIQQGTDPAHTALARTSAQPAGWASTPHAQQPSGNAATPRSQPPLGRGSSAHVRRVRELRLREQEADVAKARAEVEAWKSLRAPELDTIVAQRSEARDHLGRLILSPGARHSPFRKGRTFHYQDR